MVSQRAGVSCPARRREADTLRVRLPLVAGAQSASAVIGLQGRSRSAPVKTGAGMLSWASAACSCAMCAPGGRVCPQAQAPPAEGGSPAGHREEGATEIGHAGGSGGSSHGPARPESLGPGAEGASTSTLGQDRPLLLLLSEARRVVLAARAASAGASPHYYRAFSARLPGRVCYYRECDCAASGPPDPHAGARGGRGRKAQRAMASSCAKGRVRLLRSRRRSSVCCASSTSARKVRRCRREASP